MGGVAGVAVAQWGGAFLRSLVLSSASATVLNDPRTLAVAGAGTLAAGLLTGLAPLFQANRTDLTKDLKSGAREGAGHGSRTRTALLLFQAALGVAVAAETAPVNSPHLAAPHRFLVFSNWRAGPWWAHWCDAGVR